MATAEPTAATKVPLGAGRIIGGSFGLFFGRFGVLFLLAFVPIIVLRVLQLVLLGYRSNVQRGGSGSLADIGTYLALVEAFAPSIIAYAFVTAVIVLAAYDAKLGRPVRVKTYVVTAFSRLVMVTIVSVLVYALLILIAAAMFVIFGFVVLAAIGSGGLMAAVPPLLVICTPILYVFSMLCVATTAVMVERVGVERVGVERVGVERVGVGAIGRSIQMTKTYRWPIAGILLVLYGFVFAANWALDRVLNSIPLSGGFVSYILSLLTVAAISSVFTGLLVVGHVLIYARLREIKDGSTVDQLVEVFD